MPDAAVLAQIDAALEQAYPGPGVLSSRVVWAGGLASVLLWTAIAYLVWSYFS